MDIEMETARIKEIFLAGYDAGFFNGQRALEEGFHAKGYSRGHAWDRFKKTYGITDPTDGVGG